MIIQVGIGSRGHPVNVIGLEVLVDAGFFQYISRFVICNGCLNRRSISTYLKVAIHMYSRNIAVGSLIRTEGNTMISVQDIQVLVTEIEGVTILEYIVFSFHRIIFNSVTTHDIYLHAVIGYEEMPAPFGDLMGGVVEQILRRKQKEGVGGKVVIEKLWTNIYGGGNVYAIIPVIAKYNPFLKTEQMWAAFISVHRKSPVLEKQAGLQIGSVSIGLAGKTAKADMFSLTGHRGSVIDRPVFLFCNKYTR